MKKTLLLLLFVFGLSYSAFGSACVTATLAIYDASGFSCTIGDLTFSDFSYTSSGTIAIPEGAVTVTPESMAGETGFRFNAPWFALPDGSLLDSFIGYTATCVGCQIDDWVLSILGANAPGNSAVNVTESANELSTSLSAGSFGGVTTSMDSGTFPPVGSLTVGKDILIYGGTDVPGGKLAQVSSVTNLFSTTTSMVPEPSLVLLCGGLLAFVPIARRKFVR